MKHVINQVLIDFHKVYPDVKVPPIKFNGRLTRSGGRYLARKRDNSPVRIELSPHYLTTEERVKSVLLHELAHLVAGFQAGHGPAWLEVVNKLNGDPSVTHNFKLPFKCNHCGKEHERLMPRRGRYWVCDDCGGPLNKV